jgi:glycopeptide antibiotics resistance protein
MVAFCTAVLLGLTLSPHNDVRGVNLVPLDQTWRAARGVFAAPDPLQHPAFNYLALQVMGNIAAFVPFGFATAGLLRGGSRLWTLLRVVAWGFLLSLAIELTQLVMVTRATDVDDLIFNTLGTFLGASLLLAFSRPERQKP